MKRFAKLIVPQGIGDIFWIYQKLYPYVDELELSIVQVGSARADVQKRSENIFKSFPKVVKVSFTEMAAQESVKFFSSKMYIGEIVEQIKKTGKYEGKYIVNRWLEEGTRLEDIDPEYPPEFSIKLPMRRFELYDKDTFVILYVSGDSDRHPDPAFGIWGSQQWIELMNQAYEELNLYKKRLLIIGAKFDEELAYKLAAELDPRINRNVVITTPLDQLNYLFANAYHFFGYQSGLNVLCDNVDGKQTMIYFNTLPSMDDSWVKLENRGTKFVSCLFSNSYDEIIEKTNKILRVKGYRSPKERPMEIFLSGGIGDIIALESFMSNEDRARLSKIYYGTRAWHEASQMFINAKTYERIKNEHHLVFKDFNKQFPCFLTIEQAFNQRLLKVMPKNTVDYSIIKIFKNIDREKTPFNGSTFIKDTLADISKFNLPPKYYVVVPYTLADARTTVRRNFDHLEWTYSQGFVHEWDAKMVIINPHTEISVPKINGAIDLTGKTNILEAIEIVKHAVGYCGVDSSLSVIATKTLGTSRLVVKNGEGGHLQKYKHIYYAPQTDFSFIRRHLVKRNF